MIVFFVKAISMIGFLVLHKQSPKNLVLKKNHYLHMFLYVELGLVGGLFSKAVLGHLCIKLGTGQLRGDSSWMAFFMSRTSVGAA